MSSIFLSHSHENKSFARKLGSDLRKHGHIVWIDEAEILVGDSLIEKIRNGLDKVDYVVAILSKASVESEWVKRELDIAMNREIHEKRVVVLPILLEDMELPGFLKGKMYADFRLEENYATSLSLLLRGLGPSSPPPSIPGDKLEVLKKEIATAQAKAEYYSRELNRHKKLVSVARSPRLEAAIEEESKRNPHHAIINSAYAFELGSEVITLDYLLHAIGKAQRKGSHPIEALLSIEGKWEHVHLMLEAYRDYLGLKS